MDYDFGICGIYMSDIAISSRSCTERHGDFSESVVFHSSYEVSCFLFVVCLFLVGLFGFCFCCLFVLVAAWLLDERHLRYRFTLFSCVGMDNLNQWIDDRQSFERARHRQKKKRSRDRCSLSSPAISSRPVCQSRRDYIQRHSGISSLLDCKAGSV